MKRIAHLSDLHFGTTRREVVDALHHALSVLRPDLVVVSGDLTQRARPAEFIEAQDFLHALSGFALVVPGNHDIPPWWSAPFERFFRPFGRYHRNLSERSVPYFEDAELTVAGINTVAPWRFKDGWVRHEELASALLRVSLASRPHKLLVMHHSIEKLWPRVSGKHKLKTLLAMSGVTASLCGHGHRSSATVHGYTKDGVEVGFLELAAGTGTSLRVRGEPNAFSVLDLDDHVLRVQTHEREGNAFVLRQTRSYQRVGKTWAPL